VQLTSRIRQRSGAVVAGERQHARRGVSTTLGISVELTALGTPPLDAGAQRGRLQEEKRPRHSRGLLAERERNWSVGNPSRSRKAWRPQRMPAVHSLRRAWGSCPQERQRAVAWYVSRRSTPSLGPW
jgi:hypothetical protein